MAEEVLTPRSNLLMLSLTERKCGIRTATNETTILKGH